MLNRFLLLVSTLAVLFVAAPAGAQWSGLSLSPSNQNVPGDSEIRVALDASFPTTVIGGELRVDYDPEVVFLSRIEWEPGYGDDPLLRCAPVPGLAGQRGCEGHRDFLAFGHTGGLPSGKVADLVFLPVAEGQSFVDFDWVSPFADSSGGDAPMWASGATITVVPEPGFAVALGAGALTVACGARRGRSRR